MHEPTYSQALSHAWQLIWHHKILWVFGLLSVFLGQFGLNNFLGQMYALPLTVVGAGAGNSALAPEPSIIHQLGVAIAQLFHGINAIWTVWLLLIIIPLAFLCLVAAVASQGALVAASAEWFHYHRVLSLTNAWHRGVEHFWRLLVLHVGKQLITLGLIVVIVDTLPALSVTRSWYGFLGMVSMLTLVLIAALVLFVTVTYASGYIVEEEEPFAQALRRGWQLCWSHLLVSLEVSLILLAIEVGVVFTIFMGLTFLLFPTAIFTLVAIATGVLGLIKVGAALSLLLTVLVIVILGAIYNSFTTSVWIYLFMTMHHHGLKPRLYHLFNRLSSVGRRSP